MIIVLRIARALAGGLGGELTAHRVMKIVFAEARASPEPSSSHAEAVAYDVIWTKLCPCRMMCDVYMMIITAEDA
jgi:hypothetical protein